MSRNNLTEAEMDNVFGRVPKSPTAATVQLFTDAGFCEADALRGARLMESGRYLGFQDVASSMGLLERSEFERRNPRATPQRIAEVARSVPGPSTTSTTRHVLLERRTPSQARPTILERASAALAGDGRLSVCLISAGQGSSGYYPPATLQEAARSGVFPSGLQCYIDHPTESEAVDRPERSVRDLAGVLESAASYRDGALFANVRVFATHRELITERAAAIGMSIRGDGVVERKDVGGFTRHVVTKLASVQSVDFVTQAGRGGQILSVS